MTTRIINAPLLPGNSPAKMTIHEESPYQGGSLGLSPGHYEATWNGSEWIDTRTDQELQVVMPRRGEDDPSAVDDTTIYITANYDNPDVARTARLTYPPAAWAETSPGVLDLSINPQPVAWVASATLAQLTEGAQGAAAAAQLAADTASAAADDANAAAAHYDATLTDLTTQKASVSDWLALRGSEYQASQAQYLSTLGIAQANISYTSAMPASSPTDGTLGARVVAGGMELVTRKDGNWVSTGIRNLGAEAVGTEVVSSLDLLEHESDPGAHGLDAFKTAVGRTALAAIHHDVSSTDSGQTYKVTPVWYPAGVREYSVRLYAIAKEASEVITLQVALSQGWASMHGIWATCYDYNNARTAVQANAAANSNKVNLQITRPSGSPFAVGNVVIVSILIRGTY